LAPAAVGESRQTAVPAAGTLNDSPEGGEAVTREVNGVVTALTKRRKSSPWKATDRPVLAEGVEVELHLPKTIRFTRFGTYENELSVDFESQFLVDLIFWIGKGSETGPMTLTELAHASKVRVSRAIEALELLNKLGFVAKAELLRERNGLTFS